LPYDIRGPEFALYKLRKYFPTNPNEKYAQGEMRGNERLGLSFYRDQVPFQFDDAREVVSNSEIEYVNAPNMRILPTGAQTVIIATRLTPDALMSVLCITSTGQFYRLRMKENEFGSLDTLVGKSLVQVAAVTDQVIDFCAGDIKMWLGYSSTRDNKWAGLLRRDYRVPFERVLPEVRARIDIERLAYSLARYRLHNGQFPVDRRGPEYALYKLKEFDIPASKAPSLPSALRYDDSLQKVVDPPFNYLNKATPSGILEVVAADKVPFPHVCVDDLGHHEGKRYSRVILLDGDVRVCVMWEEDDAVGSYILNRSKIRILDTPYFGGSDVPWWNYHAHFWW